MFSYGFHPSCCKWPPPTTPSIVTVPALPNKIEMCILPGKQIGYKVDQNILITIDVVNCKPDESCMPVGPGDNSNLGGMGLG